VAEIPDKQGRQAGDRPGRHRPTPTPVKIRCTARFMHYRSTKTETFGGSPVNRWYANQNPQHIVLLGSAACVIGTSERFTSKPEQGRRF
jgi:hypothetical protein